MKFALLATLLSIGAGTATVALSARNARQAPAMEKIAPAVTTMALVASPVIGASPCREIVGGETRCD